MYFSSSQITDFSDNEFQFSPCDDHALVLSSDDGACVLSGDDDACVMSGDDGACVLSGDDDALVLSGDDKVSEDRKKRQRRRQPANLKDGVRIVVAVVAAATGGMHDKAVSTLSQLYSHQSPAHNKQTQNDQRESKMNQSIVPKFPPMSRIDPKVIQQINHMKVIPKRRVPNLMREVPLRLHTDHSGKILESFWHITGSMRDHLGIVLGPPWIISIRSHVGVTLG